jgi:hypothetical protein
MTALSIDHVVGRSVAVSDGDTELLRYTYRPDTPTLESPKPYLHPIRTRAGRTVSLFRPHDHVWHKGIAWSLPHVGSENFWGGPTYVHGRFYVQLENNGSQEHRSVLGVTSGDDQVSFEHSIEWMTQQGRRWFTERRTITASILDDRSWALVFATEMTNVSGASISIGSPTTKGRENAGYGGLFWRGPRSFTGGRLVSASGSAGDEVRGARSEWLAFAGRHDETDDESLVLMVDHRDNPHHPPQWFARSEEFACLNPAPFFSEELEITDGETVRFAYGVGIADSGADAASDVADGVRKCLVAAVRSPVALGLG